MGNKDFKNCFCFLLPLLILFILSPVSDGQLAPSETRILFQVQKLLEYPSVLQGWTNWTNFCYLPPSPFLKIVCSNTHVTELTIIGNKTSPSQTPKPITSLSFEVSQHTLSENFSIDAFFTVLTKLSYLKVLSLVSLGLWGPLPAKIKRLWSLQVLNVSSNFIYGEIPQNIVSLKMLSSLVLADNLLNGSIPDLKTLVSLQELNFGNNHFASNFPSLSNSLVTIILSNNSLRSVIPPGIKNFYKLERLDISSNKLIGPIPSSLFSLFSIEYLDLAQNQFNGALPSNISCNPKLKFVDISNNLLIGKLPSCIASSSPNRTVIGSRNCFSGRNYSYQHPFAFCHKEALAVKPPVESGKEKSSAQLGLILGIIGGVVGVTGLLGLLILVIVKRSKTTRANGGKFDGFFADKMSVTSSSVQTMDSRRVPQTMRSAAVGLPPYHVFTLEEIEDATNNFDPMNFMGEGSQGQAQFHNLYKGWVRDGSVVLIKCMKLKQKHSPQNLLQHMEVLSKLRHLHLVSVLGHCIVTSQDRPSTATTTVFVVLEHISYGSLKDYLTEWRKKDVLKWPQRMAITIGVARGIQFLHTGVAPGIFGNNLNIENILLDESLTAKLSNNNIPMPSKVGSESPLSGQDGIKAEKEDVYQLGVILVQIITGKIVTSTSELEELKIQLEKGLAEGPSKLRPMVDPSTRGTFAYESLRTTVKITISCISKEPSNRPSIEDVLWNLQYSNQVQEGWASSGNLGTQM
ncbi:hypothetical protein JCGZ_21687 [Jatropha curcas]|uniref:non-specific serine/threonine protein kinase n=1 Tax=Jatropha curcas TaxID=180498 RepID=A0A067JBP7_JATCU|nr:probable LRR receptor-like serine/threonine-protein kinase At1g14390 isoform X2 [Jatropha curcas]KDP21216.1 hypothetical protein JCGZ_21687 [Jatropha curcas]